MKDCYSVPRQLIPTSLSSPRSNSLREPNMLVCILRQRPKWRIPHPPHPTPSGTNPTSHLLRLKLCLLNSVESCPSRELRRVLNKLVDSSMLLVVGLDCASLCLESHLNTDFQPSSNDRNCTNTLSPLSPLLPRQRLCIP